MKVDLYIGCLCTSYNEVITVIKIYMCHLYTRQWCHHNCQSVSVPSNDRRGGGRTVFPLLTTWRLYFMNLSCNTSVRLWTWRGPGKQLCCQQKNIFLQHLDRFLMFFGGFADCWESCLSAAGLHSQRAADTMYAFKVAELMIRVDGPAW